MKNIELTKQVNKLQNYYDVMNQWIHILNAGKSVSEYFKKQDVTKIAIYAWGELAKRLAEELAGTQVAIEYVVDINAYWRAIDYDLYYPEDDLPEADMMVVTATFDYYKIEKAMKEKVSFPIVSLEDILYKVEWI